MATVNFNIPAFQSPIISANADDVTTTPTIGVKPYNYPSVALVPRPRGSGIQPVLFTFEGQSAENQYKIKVGDMTTDTTADTTPIVIASGSGKQIWTVLHHAHEQRGNVYIIKRPAGGSTYEAWTTDTTNGTIYLSTLNQPPTSNQYFKFEL